MRTKVNPLIAERESIGRQIASRLPQVRSQVDVARELGISRTELARVESLALWKLRHRLGEILKADGLPV